MSSKSFVESILTNNYCSLAALTLIGCEYFALMPREIELIWMRGITGASVLFLSNRYLSLLSQVVQIASIKSEPHEDCAILVNAILAISLLPYLPFAAFSGLRTYALCRKRLFGLSLGMLGFLLSSVPVAVNFTRYRWLSSALSPTLGCFEMVSISEDLAKEFTIASRTCLIAADLIVLGITWRATYRTSQLARAAGQQRVHSFAATLLRDGTLYFLVLVTLNTLHLLFTMLSISSDSLVSISYVTIFSEPITAVLMSRFILDLQAVNQNLAAPHLTSLSSGQSSVVFTEGRIIGSLESSLPPPSDTLYEHADDWDTLTSGNDEVHGAAEDTDVIALNPCTKISSSPISA